MSARLGNVLYWLGCIVTVPCAIWVIVNAWVLTSGSSVPGENARQILIAGSVGIGAWLFGRACRYVLAGT